MSDATIGTWDGGPAIVRKVRLEVGSREGMPYAWFGPFIGRVRDAVEVRVAEGDGERVFYLDDADGTGWGAVTGKGGPVREVFPAPESVVERA